jgi:hypothetical protein
MIPHSAVSQTSLGIRKKMGYRFKAIEKARGNLLSHEDDLNRMLFDDPGVVQPRMPRRNGGSSVRNVKGCGASLAGECKGTKFCHDTCRVRFNRRSRTTQDSTDTPRRTKVLPRAGIGFVCPYTKRAALADSALN